MPRASIVYLVLLLCVCTAAPAAQDPFTQYSAPCVERQDVFAFTQKPVVKLVEKDRYEITFAVKGNCDVTVGLVDEKGTVVRHLASGVLGANAPEPFQKNSLAQKLYWNGKDDLDIYVKEPEKLEAKVSLGLKPVFDKRLGGTSAKNLPGVVAGIAIGPDGAYVFCVSNCGGFGHGTIRKFDRDGGYAGTILPPPQDLPESKLGGMGYIEYEKGTRALHGPDLGGGFCGGSHYAPAYTLDSWNMHTATPVVAGTRLVFANAGWVRGSPGSFIHYLYTDGATDVRGIDGLTLTEGGGRGGFTHHDARLAASPDGKTVYVTGLVKSRSPSTCVFVRGLDAEGAAKVFAGDPDKPGSDNAHFNDVGGVDCDAEGRVYVADSANNRIQVFSPAGKFLKTIRIDRPKMICVHKKTGAIYVLHGARKRGASVGRVTKLVSFDDPGEALHWDGVGGLMALDSWSERPRLWFSGRIGSSGDHFSSRAEHSGTGSVTIWEERGKKFEKIEDFQETYMKEAGDRWFGRWDGVGTLVMMSAMTYCDPTREKAYYKNYMFDLKTGRCNGRWKTDSGSFDEIGFDKRGYMHGHQNCRAGTPCAWRVDPSRAEKRKVSLSPSDRRSMSARVAKAYEAMDVTYYPECPYDYGEQKPPRWVGALPTKCQAGAKGFQDGFGVSMRGEVAVESNIHYVPKMDDIAQISAVGEGYSGKGAAIDIPGGKYNEEGLAYQRFVASIKEAQKKGIEVYSIKRKPGIPLSDATVWIFDASGELRTREPMVIGGLFNGLKIDEDRSVYFTMNRTRWVDGRRFLNGKSGRFGMPPRKEAPNRSVFTGTYAKARPGKLTVWMNNAPIPMDEPPKREPDVRGSGGHHSNGDKVWMQGVDWLYAGASPIVVSQPCSCFQLRAHLDWYKRSYVPEGYRHSIGILDTNGNVIGHVGRYANFDSAPGGPKGCKPGGTDIGMTSVRYIGGTDNYLAFEDWGEKMVVLRLEYHAEESAAISTQ